MSERSAAIRAAASPSTVRCFAGARRRSGACRNRRPPTACQPKKRLTRSRTTGERCWISIATGPSTRSTRMPGSGVSPSDGRDQWIFSGSECSAISAPTMSGQRVTSSVEAKPCLANAALSVRWRTSASGRGKDLPGLFTLQGSATSVGQDASAIPPDVKCSQTTTARHHPLPPLRGRDQTERVPRANSISPKVVKGQRKRASQQVHARAADLLAWYDRHRRALPWRAAPGERPDPYRVWLSEVMLQQTTTKAVAPYFARFAARWPNVRALAAAPLEDVLKLWAGLGYYARARHLHACAKAVVARHGGCFPRSEAALASLPGVGPYTAAAIAAIAFGAPVAAVDGNVERVVARLYAIEDELPAAKQRIRRLAECLVPAERAGDFAQALMDLGATICTPKRPACSLCPWTSACDARRRGDPEAFPAKAPKKEGRLRRGAAFVVLRS